MQNYSYGRNKLRIRARQISHMYRFEFICLEISIIVLPVLLHIVHLLSVYDVSL